ncbi:hypothetical protein C8F04DRAFT_1401315 [Mycena alexandri]|uniref:Uncharacterized protein n=1 Tax=Mycena alexandri TaxID=1745969 RepID=A0AAD6SAT7_9AGAR|nr:hypothetical protein C8F04DRAFT_1401315 [Mycena alexandri]
MANGLIAITVLTNTEHRMYASQRRMRLVRHALRPQTPQAFYPLKASPAYTHSLRFRYRRKTVLYVRHAERSSSVRAADGERMWWWWDALLAPPPPPHANTIRSPQRNTKRAVPNEEAAGSSEVSCNCGSKHLPPQNAPRGGVLAPYFNAGDEGRSQSEGWGERVLGIDDRHVICCPSVGALCRAPYGCSGFARLHRDAADVLVGILSRLQSSSSPACLLLFLPKLYVIACKSTTGPARFSLLNPTLHMPWYCSHLQPSSFEPRRRVSRETAVARRVDEYEFIKPRILR